MTEASPNILRNESCDTLVLTFVDVPALQEPDLVQVVGRDHGQGDGVPHGLVEARVGPTPEDHVLFVVLEVVLAVPHLVVDRVQVFHVDLRAHLDSGGNDRK